MKNIKKLTLSAMFIGLGLVLPFLTMQIPQVGKMLLPMHVPVLLCGLICGWPYGLLVGCVVPLFRGAIFGTPVFFPSGLAMAFELAAYGLIAGWMYAHAKWHCLRTLYRSLITAMIGGRIIWGIAMSVILGASGSMFTFQAFISGAFLTAIPGIIMQLVLIPAIMVALNKTGMIFFHKEKGKLVKNENRSDN